MKQQLSKAPYKGCRDLFPPQKRVQEFLFEKMKETCKAFAYEPYDGPLLEPIDLYLAKSGEELINEQIYSFKDRAERTVAIRPEMTPTLARMIANCYRELPRPIRWYAIPNLMRYERPQKGRLREHWQLNVDIFGAPSPFAEVEIWQVLTHLFLSFGAKKEHFSIQVNDRKIVDALLEKLILNDEQKYRFYKLVDRYKKITKEEVTQELSKIISNPIKKQMAQDYLDIKNFTELKKWCEQSEISPSVISTLEQAFELTQSLGLMANIEYDPSIVRGLDYYTGIVFEVFDQSSENRRALSGGGSYDKLLEIFNEEPLPACGFGLGDVTLTDFLTTHQLIGDFSKVEMDFFVCYQQQEGQKLALVVGQELRKSSCRVEVGAQPMRPKKAFSISESKKIKAIIFIGEEEFKNNQLQCKILSTQEQLTLEVTPEALLTLARQVLTTRNN